MHTASTSQAKFTVACAMLLCASVAGRAHAEQYSKAYAVTGRANVQVNARWGGVRVTTSSASKVEFYVTYDKRDWAADPPIESRQDGNVVALRALADDRSDDRSWWTSWGWWGWGGYSSHRLDIEVRMPKDADLQLQTTNGPIDVSSVNGNISIHTRNGRVNAQQLAGTIDIGSTNGGIDLDSLKGTLSVRTTNGHITASRLDGKCDLATSNGGMQVEGRFESLYLSSTNGGVVARAERGSTMLSNWTIHTTNGRVDLEVPTDLKANLNVDTNNGRIKLDLPVLTQGYEDRGRIRGTLNGGGPQVSVSTTNAGIHVRGI
jgi:Putative adhesin